MEKIHTVLNTLDHISEALHTKYLVADPNNHKAQTKLFVVLLKSKCWNFNFEQIQKKTLVLARFPNADPDPAAQQNRSV
jgi:hypothetical protein